MLDGEVLCRVRSPFVVLLEVRLRQVRIPLHSPYAAGHVLVPFNSPLASPQYGQAPMQQSMNPGGPLTVQQQQEQLLYALHPPPYAESPSTDEGQPSAPSYQPQPALAGVGQADLQQPLLQSEQEGTTVDYGAATR
jgi:hypothetical protein